MTSLRVGIVGAGASGLSAALALGDLGHEAVVFEAADRVGGKCLSMRFGSSTVDLGAVLVDARGEVARLASRMKRPLAPMNHDDQPALVDLALRPVYASLRARAGVAIDLLRLEALYRQWRAREAKGGGPQPEDRISALDYLRANGLARLEPIVRSFVSSYGYGFVEDMPASVFLLYYRIPRPYLLKLQARASTIAGGYGALWEDVAAHLDVRLSTPVLSATRGVPCRIVTPQGEERFDALVFACQPSQLLKLLDTSDSERALLENVRTISYHALAFEGRGLPGCYVHLADWCRPGEIGRPMVWYRPREGGYCQTWSFAPDGASLAEVEAGVRRSARLIGADAGRTLAHYAWDYFPHFSLEATAAGARQALRGWQGRGAGFFVGEIFSFATVEHVVAHARALMRAFFDPA